MKFKVGDVITLTKPHRHMWCFSDVKFKPEAINCTIVVLRESGTVGVEFNKEDISSDVLGLHRLGQTLRQPNGWWFDIDELKALDAKLSSSAFQGPLHKYHKICVKVKQLQKKFEERHHVIR